MDYNLSAATTKPMTVQAPTVNLNQTQAADPSGLLSRLNPQDLMALRLMNSSSNGSGLLNAWGNNLRNQGFSDQEIGQLLNMGQGNSGQMAMQGDWWQQMRQKYGPNGQLSDVFAGSPYAQYFQPQTGWRPGQPLVQQGQQASNQPASTNPMGSPNPTDGTWNVNTFYAQAGQQQPTSTSNTQGWFPTNNFQPTSFGSFTNNGFGETRPTNSALTTQMNGSQSPGETRQTVPNPASTMPQPRGTPNPVSNTRPISGGGSGYNFVAPGWGSNVRWRPS